MPILTIIAKVETNYSIKVVKVNEAYSSKTCHCDLKVSPANRQTRGCYTCSCGWSLQTDVNASLNLFERQFDFSPLFGKRNLAEKVSPKRSSGVVATPVVLPWRLGRQMVYKSDFSIPALLALSAQLGAALFQGRHRIHSREEVTGDC
jgi:hypothetical protein